MKPLTSPERDENGPQRGLRREPILKGLLSRMGEDQGEGDSITPEAVLRDSGRIYEVGFAIDFIPLILTFSHPGEGTHRRREAASRTSATATPQIFEAGAGESKLGADTWTMRGASGASLFELDPR
jgi:hypothetical protein